MAQERSSDHLAVAHDLAGWDDVMTSRPTIVTPPTAKCGVRRQSRGGGSASQAAATTAAAVRSQQNRRVDDVRVTRAMDESFYEWTGSMRETHFVGATNLRMAVADLLFPDEGEGKERLSPSETARLRTKYAHGDVPECVLKLTPDELQVQMFASVSSLFYFLNLF